MLRGPSHSHALPLGRVRPDATRGCRAGWAAQPVSSSTVPAYVIVEVDVRDAEQYARYRAAVPTSLDAHGGRFLARGGETASLEGDWQPKRIVVIQFGDLEAAKRWYDSPEYREARAIREGAATMRMIAVEGV